MSIDITLSWSDSLLIALDQVEGVRSNLLAHVARYPRPVTKEASDYLDTVQARIEALELAMRELCGSASTALETERDVMRDPDADPLPRSSVGELLGEGYALYRQLELGLDD